VIINVVKVEQTIALIPSPAPKPEDGSIPRSGAAGGKAGLGEALQKLRTGGKLRGVLQNWGAIGPC
jgi:hypothetical protein